MTVNFDIPPSIERILRQESSDLNQAAKEAALVELYRQDKISHFELSEALGISRLETETVLKMHHVTEDFPAPDEYNAALAHLAAMDNT